MSIFDQKEREALEEADALEEARVEREAVTWAEEEAVRASLRPSLGYPPLPPSFTSAFAGDERWEVLTRYEADLEDYRRTNEYWGAVGAEQRFR